MAKLTQRQQTHRDLIQSIPKNLSEKMTRLHLEATIKHTLSEYEKREDFRNTLRVFTLTTATAAGGFIVQQTNGHQIVLLGLVFLFLVFMDIMDTFHFDLREREIEFNERLLLLLLQLTSKSTPAFRHSALLAIHTGIDSSNFVRKLYQHFHKGRFDELWYRFPMLVALVSLIYLIFVK